MHWSMPPEPSFSYTCGLATACGTLLAKVLIAGELLMQLVRRYSTMNWAWVPEPAVRRQMLTFGPSAPRE